MRPFCSVKRPLQNGIVAAGGRKMQIAFKIRVQKGIVKGRKLEK